MDRYRWAEIRDGLITIEVAAADGRSRRSRTRDRASGALRPVRRGVDAVGGSPPTWRQAVRAVVLAAGDDVAISHETALRLLGGARLVDEIHVLTPLGRQVRLAGVVTHRSGVIEDGDVVARSGIPCTSPLRTIIDLSGRLTEAQLGRAVDDLLRRKMLRLEDLRGRVNRTRPVPGRSVRRLRAVLAARIPGYDPGESELEGRILRLIDGAALPRPVQQYRVDFDGHRYRLDFAWSDRKVFLEGNGFGPTRSPPTSIVTPAGETRWCSTDGRRSS